MSTFSGSSLKVQNYISHSFTGNSGGTAYTCPLNSYAIVQIYSTVTSGYSVYISISGTLVIEVTSLKVGTYQSIYIGPGQSLTYSFPISGGTFSIGVTGVEFKNSP